MKLNYIVADVLNIPAEMNLRNYDLVLMEFGILHYFSDLNPIFELINNLLKNNGRLILTDFHPFSSKGSNYFDANLVEGN